MYVVHTDPTPAWVFLKGCKYVSPATSSDRRLLTMGILLGAAAVGVWAGNRAREYTERQPTPDLIDWGQARSLAASMNRDTALGQIDRDQLNTYYRELTERSIPMVADYTGDQLPREAIQVYAFDRIDWIGANIDNFADMFRPLESLNPLRDAESPKVFNVLWGNLNQKVLSAELGLLLGYLARRVLGQYDLALLGREPLDQGKLYFVQPNIVAIERALSLPSDDFRLWLALHETTHAFEFEAHPWLRQHMNDLLQSYFGFLNQDVEHLKRGFSGLKMIVERARNRNGDSGAWIEMVMTAEQRDLFNKMQATMCVVEGYSNHVMNAVGRDLIPTYETISKRFEQRLRQRSPAEQLFARLTGLDVKLEQYRQGEAFVNHVVRERDHAFAKQVWQGPEYLPSMDEIRSPDRWIARIGKL